MVKYVFRARDKKTGKTVIGDLAYAKTKNGIIKPMIIRHYVHGGMLWTGERWFVEESTIELIVREETV